jgi:hypothetical protein
MVSAAWPAVWPAAPIIAANDQMRGRCSKMIKWLGVGVGFGAFLFGLAPPADAQSTIYAPYSYV